MSALRTLDAQLFEVLAQSGLPAHQRTAAVALCEQVVDLVPTLDVAHPGWAARNAALLMLETGVPGLVPSLRGDLARLCEVAVVRG